MYRKAIGVDASSVLISGLVGKEDIEQIARLGRKQKNERKKPNPIVEKLKEWTGQKIVVQQTNKKTVIGVLEGVMFSTYFYFLRLVLRRKLMKKFSLT